MGVRTMTGRICIAGCLVVLLMSTFVQAQAIGNSSPNTKAVTENWDNMLHYALIGKWDLARSYGQALLDSNPDPLLLLKLSESQRYADAYRNLTLLGGKTPLHKLALQVLKLVEKGMFLRRTNTQQIIEQVKRLSGPPRAMMDAVRRLKDSGEWAIPIMIQVLRDPQRSQEWAVIRWAMPKIGRPAVNPLLVVLHDCDELNIRLIVLEVLGKIGYPDALPYIKQLIEDKNSSPKLKKAAQDAFNAIDKQGVRGKLTAAELYEQLGEDYYNYVSYLAVPSTQDFGNIWFWKDSVGLIRKEVPRASYNELLTMRCCQESIKLDSHMSSPISLWLSAFFRLEAKGQKQPAYFGPHHADAATYALTAGPEYLHMSLARALKNRNRPVALAIIHVLQRNAGQQSLLYDLQGVRPLINALSYPDREVRFSAALAIAQILPQQQFENSEFVVPILAEALRQKGNSYALVAVNKAQQRGDLTAALRGLGKFKNIVSNKFFSSALEQAKRLPSLDMIVLSDDITHPDVRQVISDMQKNYRLTFCPTIVMASQKNLLSLRSFAKKYPFVEVVSYGTPVDEIISTSNNILKRNHARPFANKLADRYAQQAANVLWQLAMTDNKVLSVKKAQKALIKALYDKRPKIQQAAIRTLARMNSVMAQRAVANLALDGDVELPVRLLAFANLSVSARRYGDLLLVEQVNDMYNNIVRSLTVDPQLRMLAAQAYGALNLPSPTIGRLILDQAKPKL